MINVALPRASWDQIELILEDLHAQGFIVGGLLNEIKDQTHAQEG